MVRIWVSPRVRVRVRHRVRVRVRLDIGLGLGFHSSQSQCVPPFRKLSYSCKIRNETQSFRSAIPFRKLYQPFDLTRIMPTNTLEN